MRVSPKVGNVVSMREVREDDELVLTSSNGVTIRVRVGDISKIGRVTQGVRVMSVASDERVVAVDVVMDKDDEQELALDEAEALPTEDLET
jgi:DNA gyrase subunit A